MGNTGIYWIAVVYPSSTFPITLPRQITPPPSFTWSYFGGVLIPGKYIDAPMLHLHSGHFLCKRKSGNFWYFLFQPYKEYIFRLYLSQTLQFLLVDINSVSIFHFLHWGTRRWIEMFSIFCWALLNNWMNFLILFHPIFKFLSQGHSFTVNLYNKR